MTPAEYVMALRQREALNNAIREYEQEFRRGCLKVNRTLMGPHRERDGYSLRVDYRFDRGDGRAYWKTVFTTESREEMIHLLERISEDAPLVLEGFKAGEINAGD